MEWPVAVSNMKICVIRAIREPKLLSMFYSLTDFTDFTDMEPWAALGGVTSCSQQHKNLCDPCNPWAKIISCVFILSQISQIPRIWSLARLFRKQVAVSNMKICVICAIREPKLLSMFYSLTDFTDFTDLSLARLFRKLVAVGNIKICVIRAIREPK